MKRYEVAYTISKSKIIMAKSREEAEERFVAKHSFSDGYEVDFVTEAEE